MSGNRIQTYPMQYTLPNGKTGYYHRDGNHLCISVFVVDMDGLTSDNQLLPAGFDPDDCALLFTFFDVTQSTPIKHLQYRVNGWCIDAGPKDPKDPKAWILPRGYKGWTKEKTKQEPTKNCTCSMAKLMLHGCKCGGK